MIFESKDFANVNLLMYEYKKWYIICPYLYYINIYLLSASFDRQKLIKAVEEAAPGQNKIYNDFVGLV